MSDALDTEEGTIVNRREALEILDRVHPGELDEPTELDDEVRVALESLQDDPSAAEEWRTRRAIDERVVRLLDATPVPEGGREALRAELGLDSPPSAAAHDERRAKRISRRWLLRGTLAAGLLGGMALGLWWSSGPAVGKPSLVEIRDQAIRDFAHRSELPRFDGGFTPRLPWSGWTRRRFDVSSEPVALALPGREASVAAGYVFRLRGSRGTPGVDGVLLVVPASRVAAVPSRRFFDPGSATYTQPYASVAWIEGDLCYVCVVHGGARELESIDRALDFEPA